MKKILLFILSLALVLLLVACGENKDNNQTSDKGMLSVEEMLEQATELTYDDINNSKPWENLVRAENTYVGNTYTTSAYFVKEVGTEYAILGNAYGYSNVKIKIYLSREELALLNYDEQVKIVGIVDSIEKESDFVAIFTMKEAHFVTNRMKRSGEYKTFVYKGTRYGYLKHSGLAIAIDSDEIKNLDKGVTVEIEGVIHYDAEMTFYYQQTAHISYIMTEATIIK